MEPTLSRSSRSSRGNIRVSYESRFQDFPEYSSELQFDHVYNILNLTHHEWTDYRCSNMAEEMGQIFFLLITCVTPDVRCAFSFLFAFPSLYPAKAQVYEKVSLQGIQQLVHRSYQTLALWKLLCDHQFSLIMSELPKVNVCTNRCSYIIAMPFTHMPC